MNTTNTRRAASPLSSLHNNSMRGPDVNSNEMSSYATNNQNLLVTASSTSVSTPISSPIFISVDPTCFTRFLKDRKRYELYIASKESDLPSLKSLA